MFHEGLLVVVSGPSGTGKGTLLNLVRQRNENVKFSVSATTRSPRKGEIDGQNYFYKSVQEFKDMIKNDELIEWVEYCENFYGTPKEYVNKTLSNGYDVILEIEVEGAVNIKKKFPDCVTLFVLPPSFNELKKRIEGRGTEKEEVIRMRLEKAKLEMQLVHNYDYVILNDDIESAYKQFCSILDADKLKYSRNTDILKEILGG